MQSQFEEMGELSEEWYQKMRQIYPHESRERLLEIYNGVASYLRVAYPIASRLANEGWVAPPTKNDQVMSNNLDLLSKEEDLTKEELKKVLQALDEYLLIALKIHSKITKTSKLEGIIKTLETDLA